jgi:hypothetical protein
VGLPTASVLRLATDATRTLTGLAGGADGRLLCIVNAGNNGILLANEDTNSAPANRFSIGANLTIAAGQSVMLLYDAIASRWRALSAGAAGGGAGEGPQVETKAGWNIDGVEIRVILDCGAGFIDWRGWYVNAGP